MLLIVMAYNIDEVMIMYAIKAIYDGTNFKPKQPISVKGQYEVVITFVEPINKEMKYNPRNLLEPDMNKIPRLGELDGIVEIPDDFDEPLDEMKEYMY